MTGYQNQGIGSELIRCGNSMARLKGYKKIFVLRPPHFYARFGFHMAREYNYYSKCDPERNHFLVLGGDLKHEAGKIVVHYSEEFNV